MNTNLMKIRVAIPMSFYYQFELIMPIGNMKDIDKVDYPRIDKILSTEVPLIHGKTIDQTLDIIIENIKNIITLPAIFRLWLNKSMYIEREVIE